MSIIPRRVIALHDFDLRETLRMYDRIDRYVSYIYFLLKKICFMKTLLHILNFLLLLLALFSILKYKIGYLQTNPFMYL